MIPTIGGLLDMIYMLNTMNPLPLEDWKYIPK